MKVDDTYIFDQVAQALKEDVGSGDVTANLIDENASGEGVIITRQPMVLCGQAWVDECFQQIHSAIKVHWLVAEGTYIDSAQPLCQLSGNYRGMLTAERTALNFLQTLSATATQVKQYVDKIAHTECQLLDTRKTIPGLRLAQKYAVQCGGGVNHRFGLYDAYLIKENHISAAGTMSKAVQLAKQQKPNIFLEIEVENLTELQEALMLPVDRIMLDNFTLDDMVSAVKLRGQSACELEVSGNVSLETIQNIAQTGVDYVSVGAITKSINAIDLSLRIKGN